MATTPVSSGVSSVHVPVEPWSIREQLWLSAAVVRNGDQNWMSVSRSLKPLTQVEQSRPSDWFSHKACAAQYGALLDNVRTPRRKKRGPDNTPSSPAESSSPQDTIMKRLIQERISELQKLMADTEQSYSKLKDEVKELKSSNITETRVKTMYSAYEAEQRNKDHEAARRAQWLKEREDRRALLERTWRRPETAEPPHPSPLLTSLLQSPTSLGHLPPAAETPSPSAAAPTLSLLLEKTPSDSNLSEATSGGITDIKPLPKTELQEIEQIKSQLQEIEQRLIGGTMPTDSNVLTHLSNLPPMNQQMMVSKDSNPDSSKTCEKMDIDDIEIKAEDVYAFSDIDLDIPPVSSIHKSLGRTLNSDKNLSFNKKEANSSSLGELGSPVGAPDTAEVLSSLLSPESQCVDTSVVANQSQPDPETPAVIEDTPLVPEIAETELPKVENIDTITPPVEIPIEKTEEPVEEPSEPVQEQTETVKEHSEPVKEHEDNPEKIAEVEIMPKPVEANEEVEEEKKTEEIVPEPIIKTEPKDIILPEEPKDEVPQTPTKTAPEKDPQPSAPIPDQQPESNIETDDDTPIEVIKEDKPGKTKRDYSRKKADKDGRSTPAEIDETIIKSECSDDIGSDNSQSATERKSLSRRFRISGSRSESPATPMDSLPGSPAPATPPPSTIQSTSSVLEQEKIKAWKKQVLPIHTRVTLLKFASLFARPITDEQAPKYSHCIKKPTDLSTIKRNIESGVIKKSIEFERDVLLMLTNALMYNRTDHDIHEMAKETMKEAIRELSYLTYIPESEATVNTPVQRARPRPVAKPMGTPKRKRGGGSTSSDSATKKKKAEDQ